MQRLDRSASLAALLTLSVVGACANPSDSNPSAAAAVSEVRAAEPAATARAGTVSVAEAAPDPATDPAVVAGDRRAPWSPPVLDVGADLSKIRLSAGAAPDRAVIGPQPAILNGTGAGASANAAANIGAAANIATGQSVLASSFEGPDGQLTLAPGTDAHDFGALVQGAVVEHMFTIQSTGENPLIVQSTKQSCGCTVATAQRVSASGEREAYIFGQAIPAGESLEITARLNTDGKKNQLHSTVTVFSNDPARTHQLRLSANVQPFFVFEPNPYIQFGRLFANESSTKQVTVTSAVVDRFGLSVNTEGMPEHLSVELQPIEPDAEGRAATWTVIATILPGGPETPSQNFPLRLISDVEVSGAPAMPDGSVRTQSAICYTVAQIVGLVSAAPYYISFGLVRPGQALEREFTIEIADEDFTPGAMPVAIRGRQPQDEELLADRLTWSVAPIEGEPRKYRVALTLADFPDSFNGPFGGHIDVEVGHPTKQTLSIPFSGVVRTNIVRPQPPAVMPSHNPAVTPGQQPAAGSAPAGEAQDSNQR